jgi:GDP-L-fucose synthase
VQIGTRPKFTAADAPIVWLSAPLEPTNQWYAVAKIAGIKLCEGYRRQYGANFISAMPTNLYGPHDNFDLNSSHVLPALIRKFHDAKVRGELAVEIWAEDEWGAKSATSVHSLCIDKQGRLERCK